MADDYKPKMEKHIQKMNGKMTVEHVAEGFFQLATKCENGSAMAVLKGVPYMLVPDCSIPMIIQWAMVAKILDRLLGLTVVKTNHQIVGFFVAIVLILLLTSWLL